MRWLAGVLALALLSCGGSSDSGSGGGEARGKRLYTTLCISCHGPTGGGGALAPPLADLSSHWEREQLAEYLSDPRAWVEQDERLQGLKQRYSMEMPAVSAPEADRLLLADHVLRLSAGL
jgi:mono/diheme cytochrome c family protein